MKIFDFDRSVQSVLNNTYAEIKSVDWRKWLEISTPKEFEELCLKQSGLESVENLFNKIKEVKTSSRSFSLDLESFIDNYNKSYIPTLCHTSGTTNSNLSALKWFFMSKEVVKRNWAPGMQAIFESSGLTNDNSAIIFVPSRIKHDGLQSYNGQDYVSLYSSEFSQRIMLSIVKPKSYLLYEYKYAKTLEIITKILQLEDVAVISAPALTILGWANRDKLTSGIKASLSNLPEEKDPQLTSLIEMIKSKGLEDAVQSIQKNLSEKLSGATIVFSISSLSEDNWNLIRNFMHWEKGKEKFTNLYVISEVGPFAASISKKNYVNTHYNDMFVFPLSLAALETKSKIVPISQMSAGHGKLYVSRMDEKDPLINIDLGDVIMVLETNDGLPLIEGKILRSSFKLQYPINLSNQINTPSSYEIFAGDYFIFNDFDLKEPRKLLFFLKENCNFHTDSMLLVSQNDKNDKYKLVLPSSSLCQSEESIKKKITQSKAIQDFCPLFEKNIIQIELIEDQPVNFYETRTNKLQKVRNGEIPKGILKKWPLYVLT